MRQWTRVICFFLVLFLTWIPVHALKAQASSSYPKKGFRAEVLKEFDGLSEKFVSLAEAFPGEKYAWRPAEGVRSVGEVFGHVASGNYFFSTWLGAKIPDDIHPDEIEKMTDKTKLLEALKKSIDFYRQAVLKVGDDGLENMVKMMNRQGTTREALLFVAAHEPEHLGQLIAYARMNGVVPPWTAARQQQMKK